MALTERSRAIAYRSLRRVFDDEETTEAVMSTLALDSDRFVTKDDIALAEANLRAEIQAATKSMLMWYIGISTTQLGIVVGLVLAVR